MKKPIITFVLLNICLLTCAQTPVWKLDLYWENSLNDIPFRTFPVEGFVDGLSISDYVRFKVNYVDANNKEIRESFKLETNGLKMTYRLDEGFVENLGVIDVGLHTATLSGRVYGTAVSTTVGVEYAASGSNDIKRVSTEDNGFFTLDIMNLEYYRTYYYRTFAIVNGKEYYGDYMKFTTKSPVVTGSATNITGSSVTLNGVVNTVIDPVICGIEYRESSSDTYKTLSTLSNNSYSVSVTGLREENTYYYRAFAIINDRTIYGEEKSFYTPKETYEVGDLYSNEGVVYYVDSSKKHGKIFSADRIYGSWKEGRDWCYSKGTGWSMPSLTELKKIAALHGVISHFPEETFYWSSTDYGTLNGSDPDYNLYYIVLLGNFDRYSNGWSCENTGSEKHNVLAVKSF